MTTARARATDLLVVDMSTLRFQWNADHSTCAALTARGEIVAVYGVDRPGLTDAELAYQLMDAALDHGQVLRPDPADPTARVAYRIGLYNPFTAEVSVGPVPDTVTFGDGEPLALPAEGLPAQAVTTGRAPALCLPGGRELAPRVLTFAGLTRTQIAHQAA